MCCMSSFAAVSYTHLDVYKRQHQSDSSGVLRALRTGRFDLGLTGMTAPDEDLVFTPFYQDAMVLIAPNTPEFSAAKAQNMPLAALLQSHPLLLRENGSGSQRSADEFLRAAGLEPDALQEPLRP